MNAPSNPPAKASIPRGEIVDGISVAPCRECRKAPVYDANDDAWACPDEILHKIQKQADENRRKKVRAAERWNAEHGR